MSPIPSSALSHTSIALVHAAPASTLPPHLGRAVEGVDHCKGHSTVFGRESDCTFPSAAGQDSSIPASFWGENLMGALDHPVRVHDASGAEVAGKVVYSPHTYGPSVYDQVMFHDAGFPGSMPRIWDAQYGRLGEKRHDAIIIGEWSVRREPNSCGLAQLAIRPRCSCSRYSSSPASLLPAVRPRL